MNMRADIMVDEGEFGKRLKMSNVAHIPRDEVVHSDYFVALSDKAIAQMGPKEAGRAGNEDTWHYFSPIPL